MAEAAIRKFLPKDEQIVMAWIGSVIGLVGVSKMTGKKKAPEDTTKKAPSGGDNGLGEVFNQPGLEDLREAFGAGPAPFEPVGNKHAVPLQIGIFAPPAGGKGTQCANICDKYGVKQFSTGDALRAQVKAGTEIGKKAKGFMDAGELVPNDVIEKVILATVADLEYAEKGYILDGVCRTQSQSEFVVREGLMPQVNIVLEVPDDEVVRRISGRRIGADGKSYHTVFAPPPPGLKTTQRADDNEVVVRKRLEEYKAHKAGALAPYPPDSVVTVNGLGKPQEVWARVDAVLAGAKAGVTAARTQAAFDSK
jgi:adenylate kinase